MVESAALDLTNNLLTRFFPCVLKVIVAAALFYLS